MQALADAAVEAQLEEAPLGADEAASSGGPDQPPQPPEPATHSTAGSELVLWGKTMAAPRNASKRGAAKIESQTDRRAAAQDQKKKACDRERRWQGVSQCQREVGP